MLEVLTLSVCKRCDAVRLALVEAARPPGAVSGVFVRCYGELGRRLGDLFLQRNRYFRRQFYYPFGILSLDLAQIHKESFQVSAKLSVELTASLSGFFHDGIFFHL